jgi:hypothetical protein
MKKLVLIFSFATLFLALPFVPSAQARITPKGLAVTGVVLGGTALGVAGYNYYRNHRTYNNRRSNYGYGYNNGYRQDAYYPVNYYNGPSRRPCGTGYGYQQRYNNYYY